jgi:cytochrome oxidase Cu insertion factor (SCO1/SenC/PrrC family)
MLGGIAERDDRLRSETFTTLKENPMTARPTNTSAPDFTLTDIQGRTVHLTDYRGKANVVLVFNRGVL